MVPTSLYAVAVAVDVEVPVAVDVLVLEAVDVLVLVDSLEGDVLVVLVEVDVLVLVDSLVGEVLVVDVLVDVEVDSRVGDVLVVDVLVDVRELQIRLLPRLRSAPPGSAEEEQLRLLVLQATNGIAAGLQTTG